MFPGPSPHAFPPVSVAPQVADVLGMPPAETSSLSASVQQFLTDVVASVDPFGTHARGVQQSLDAVFAAPAGPGSGGARSPTAAGSTPASPAGAWGAGGAAADPGVGPPAPPAVEEPVDEPGDRDGIQWREPASPLAPLALAGEASAASTGGAVPGAGDPNVALALQRSAYLVFRALCKLSIRSVDGGGGTDATTARGKVGGACGSCLWGMRGGSQRRACVCGRLTRAVRRVTPGARPEPAHAFRLIDAFQRASDASSSLPFLIEQHPPPPPPLHTHTQN